MILTATAFAIALAANTAGASPATAKDPDKLICRREARTGSLVGTTRSCKTRKEWAAISEANRRDVDRLRDNSSPRSTNGADFTPF
jgi:hypothetical protein